MPLSAAQRRQRRAQGRYKVLTCHRCGETFRAVRQTAQYCSATCRQPLSPEMADKLVRRHFKRRAAPPETLAELLRDIGLTRADAALLCQKYGRYYFAVRYAQAFPKPFPSGQEPAAVSMWNNRSKAYKRSLNLKKVVK